MNIKRTNTSPIQKALKFPATNPERIFNEAPPALDDETISLTCFDFVLVKIFVNSGIKAAPKVPQLITVERITQRSFGKFPIIK